MAHAPLARNIRPDLHNRIIFHDLGFTFVIAATGNPGLLVSTSRRGDYFHASLVSVSVSLAS